MPARCVGGTFTSTDRRLDAVRLRSRLDPDGCVQRLGALVDQRGPLAVRLTPRSRPALVGTVRRDGADVRLQTAIDNVFDRRLALRWQPAGGGSVVRAAFVRDAWARRGALVWCALLAGSLGLALAVGPVVSEATLAGGALVLLTLLAWRLGRGLARRREGLLLGAVVAALEARVETSPPPTGAPGR